MDTLQSQIAALRKAMADKGYTHAIARIVIDGDEICVTLRTGEGHSGERAFQHNDDGLRWSFIHCTAHSIPIALMKARQAIANIPESVVAGYAREFEAA